MTVGAHEDRDADGLRRAVHRGRRIRVDARVGTGGVLRPQHQVEVTGCRCVA